MKEEKTFYLIRHGETIWNQSQLLQGQKDIPLTENGKRQAKNIALFFKTHSFNHIGASPLIRTQQTATILAKELHIPKKTYKGLLARSYGAWEGENIHAIKKKHSLLFEEMKSWPLAKIFTQSPIPSVESYQIVSKRVFNLLKSLSKREGNVLLVAHTGVITAILLALKFPTIEIPLLSHQGYVKICYRNCQFIVEKVTGLISPPKPLQKKHKRVFTF